MCRRSICLASLALVLGFILTRTAQAENIGWWKFDEGSGNTAYDSSGKDHHANVLGAPEWVAGLPGFGGALDFTNTRGANAGDFDPTGGMGVFTLAFWCRWDGTPGIQHFFTKSNGWAAATMMFQVEVKGTHSNPDIVDRFHLAYQSQPQAVLHLVPKNEWAHMAMVFDGTNATGYLNGVDEVGPKPTGIGASIAGPVWIGVAHNDARVFQGIIDDMRVYDRVLSENEVRAIMAGEGGEDLSAYGPDPADGSLHPNTWVSLAWKAGPSAVTHDVYLGDNFDDVNDGTGGTFVGGQTATSLLVGFPNYPYPDGLVPGMTYYWRIDEVNDADPNSPWKGDVWSFSVPPRTAYYPNPADGEESVALNVSLSWTAGYEAKFHTVHFGDTFDDVNNATAGSMVAATTYNPGPLKPAKVYYWRVDETDPPTAYRGQVWSFSTLGAVGNPYPANGAGSAEMNAILSWTPGDDAASHQVYFGTDKEAVRKANTTSPEYKGTRALGTESYDPGLLAWDSAFYWRIDEVNTVNPNSPWKGPLWSFTTGDFLLVDDFEAYNDLNEGEPGSNRIYLTWVDGFGTTTNGAVVGNMDVPITERIVVHDGVQSMPLTYDNNFKYSEATMTLTTGRNWTVQGVAELSLWFRGKAANAAERMYVALNGTAVVYHDNPNAVQTDRWVQWVIPLQAFADLGVNLSNVNSISLGFGTRGNTTVAGGTGQMYIDDVRLCRPTITP